MATASVIHMKENCRICGSDVSTGYFFGTVTCEACKKFYQRHLDGKADYTKLNCVQKTGHCFITVESRTKCQLCRYKKCLQVGMSPANREKVKNIPDVLCQVCKAKAKGFHFGALTCERCKSFFRRSQIRNADFSCIGRPAGACVIDSSDTLKINCKYCHFKKCLQVGMDPKNSRVGRHTNLFKKNMQTATKGLESDASTQPTIVPSKESTSRTCDSFSSSFEDSNDSTPLFSLNLQTNEPCIENAMDLDSRNVINDICKSFAAYQTRLTYAKNLMSNVSGMLDDTHFALSYLKEITQPCTDFISSIIDGDMDEDNRLNLLISSLHAVKLIEAIFQPSHSNYFGCSQDEYERILGVFPVFGEIEPFFRYVSGLLKGLQLDKKEMVLFAALLVLTISHDCDSRVTEQIYLRQRRICNILTTYMQLRRNQPDSCEALLNLLAMFNKMTLKLRRDIGLRMGELAFDLALETESIDDFHQTIFYLPQYKRFQDQY